MMGPVEHDIIGSEKVEDIKPQATPSSRFQSLNEMAQKDSQLTREATNSLRLSLSKTLTAGELLQP